MNELWEKLLQPATLKRGWHMARADQHQDFAEDLFSADALALDLDRQVNEAISRIKTHTYQASPLMQIEVPKGSLGFRPGSVVSMRDRMVLSAIVFLLAPSLDAKLSDSVYSWRVKKPLPGKGSIFEETDILDLPYLKRRTITARVDPFDPWYAAWPAFDEQSRKTFGADGYRFLTTADIAAYFENIQLPILRDQLLQTFPDDTRVVNLLLAILEGWALRTEAGRPYLRGIPQGCAIFSFLGNSFLRPLDNRLTELQAESDLRYYRYMDDVRIFTRDIETARRAVFEMTRVLRSLHLNVQSAKTKIYDENKGEITGQLVDSRVDELNAVLEEITAFPQSSKIPRADRQRILARLRRISRRKSGDTQPIIGARRPLDGLDQRAFSRWITCHSQLGSPDYVPRLLREVISNPDYRLTRRLVRCAREFPRHRSIESRVIEFVTSDRCLFAHQRAECFRALRYLDRIGDRTREFARQCLYSADHDPYERMEAAYLLARTKLEAPTIAKCLDLFASESDPFVLCALAMIVVQRKKRNEDVIRMLETHPNDRVRLLGIFFRRMQNDHNEARKRLDHVFKSDQPWFVVDNIATLEAMASSRNADILRLLSGAIGEPSRTWPLTGIRPLLRSIAARVEEELGRVQATTA